MSERKNWRDVIIICINCLSVCKFKSKCCRDLCEIDYNISRVNSERECDNNNNNNNNNINIINKNKTSLV